VWSSLVVRWKRWELQREWVKYRAFVLQAIDAGGVPEGAERVYLAQQARIVAGLEFVAARVNGVPEAEARQAMDEIRQLLQRHRCLKLNAVNRTAAWEDFDKSWHRSFLFISRLRGAPIKAASRAPRAAFPVAKGEAVPTGFTRRRLHMPRPHFRRWLRYLVQAALLVFVIYVVAYSIGFRVADGHLVLPQTPSSFAQVFNNFMAAVNQVWAGAFGPLAASIGTLTTLLLAGLLFLLVGYWLFVRG
jgi:hypothetical protein